MEDLLIFAKTICIVDISPKKKKNTTVFYLNLKRNLFL